MVNSNFDVQLAAAASCRVARLRSSGALVLEPWGRITAPAMSSVQGTGVPTGGFGADAHGDLRQHIAFNPTSPTSKNTETKYDAVVNGTPGVRSWSPPV